MDQETFWTLRILLNAKELREQESQEEGGKMNMCKALQDLLEEERQVGLEKGRLETLYELVEDGLLSVRNAAEKASMTENVFSDEMKKAMGK